MSSFLAINLVGTLRLLRYKHSIHHVQLRTNDLQILSPLILQLKEDNPAVHAAAMKRLQITTTDSKERVPATPKDGGDGTITWDIEKMRLPIYNRHSSSLMLQLGGGASLPAIKRTSPDAIGLLWLKDLVDDEEIEVDIPVIVGKDLSVLRQNVLTDFTARTHEYQVVGHFKTRIRLDSGLDEVDYYTLCFALFQSLIFLAQRIMRASLKRKLADMHTKPSKSITYAI